MYATKDQLLAALTHTHEKEIVSPFFGGRVLIRELTARQRMLAQQAAQAENPDEPDNALYQAMLIQMCVVDPESGTADGAGRIDPRTRAPLFTVEDIRNISDARYAAVSSLIEEITSLAALGPQAMFSSNPPADGSERDAREGAAGSGDTAGEDESARSGDADGRDALAGDTGAGDGAEPSADAG
jgi:hypothetical protein